MAGLPKKYAKMGFKKGWAAYKKTKKKTTTRKVSSTRKVATMAKRKRKTGYRRTGVKTINSFSKTFLGKVTKKALPVAYGFFRNKINDGIANSAIGKQLPVTQFTDEGVMLGINALATKFGARKNPIVRRALQAAEDIELSNVGEQLDVMMQQKKGGRGGFFGM
jgi:hypothetical protein